MNVALNTTVKKFIAREVKAGRYGSAEDVVLAALHTLMQQSPPKFAPGELDVLLAEGEASIAAHGTMDGETYFRARRKRLAREVARSRSSARNGA